MGLYETIGQEVFMKHEVFGEKVEIEETDVTFESIYNKPFIPQDYIEDIKKGHSIRMCGELTLLIPYSY